MSEQITYVSDVNWDTDLIFGDVITLSMNIVDYLDGDYPSAVVLSQAIYQMKCKSTSNIDGKKAFYNTSNDWTSKTRLSRRQVDYARVKLRNLAAPDGSPIWIERLQGVPAKLYYRVEYDALIAAMRKKLFG